MSDKQTTEQLNMSERIELLKADYLFGKLNADEQAVFDEYLRQQPAEAQQLRELQQSLGRLDMNQTENPAGPSHQMDVNFYQMLEAEQHAVTKSQIQSHTESKASGQFFDRVFSFSGKQLTAVTATLFVGLLCGWVLRGGALTDAVPAKLAAAESQASELRQVTVLSLLDEPQATSRLQAVSLANDFESPSSVVVSALLNTLNHDENVNVRLAALEALERYSDSPEVRTGLIDSILQQQSPHLQVALANLMLRLQEERSVDAMKKLLENEELEPSVREKMTASVQELI